LTLAPEHELVAKITTPEQKAAVEAYVERTAKRSKENVWLMLKLFQVYSGAYAEHPLPKSQFRFGLGIMSWQDTEQELLWVPCGDEEIMLC
jgi:leucyl-tRNA synthetase